jgi:hypothetical protein
MSSTENGLNLICNGIIYDASVLNVEQPPSSIYVVIYRLFNILIDFDIDMWNYMYYK